MQVFMLIAIVLLAAAIATALLQWLWNITIPEAFTNAKKIEFWVAFRLILIGSLISGPFIHFGK